MKGFRFSKNQIEELKGANFDQLLDLFNELILIFSGDVSQTLNYMSEIDRKYKISSDDYGMADFIDDLKEKGYITQEEGEFETFKVSSKTEQNIRKKSLEQIFGKLKKSKTPGTHKSKFNGNGGDQSAELRAFQFGDSLDQISLTESIKNAQINSGIGEFKLKEEDLEIHENEAAISTSTVLMIDISHSMILYGEDRITPAKKVALALSEYIKSRYPKDSLEIIVFGNDAWQIQLKDIPYLEVGPYHTNTVAGLELAMDLLRRKKKQQ